MNKALIAPIAALVVILAKEWFGLELEPGAVETTINTLLVIVAGLGVFMNPKKEKQNHGGDS